MKTNFFKTTAILLMMVSLSCSEETNNEIDPEKAILGKWELILLTRNQEKDEVQYTPNGYVEYFSDGSMAWYNYATKEYTLLEGRYWWEPSEYIEEVTQKNVKECILHYQDIWTYQEGEPEYYPDGNGCNINVCTFISYNQMALYQLCLDPFMEDYTYVYKRKN